MIKAEDTTQTHTTTNTFIIHAKHASDPNTTRVHSTKAYRPAGNVVIHITTKKKREQKN